MYSKEEKKNLIKKHSYPSPVLKNSLRAFFSGGLICVFSELILSLFLYFGLDEKSSLTLVSVTVIFLASLLTGLGAFDSAARFCGAGTLVPVSGFSNAVTSEAMDARSEGVVLGVGAKIFTVAGPVILFGLLSGVLYGLIYFLYSLI